MSDANRPNKRNEKNHNKFWSKAEEATLQDYMRNSELGLREISEAMGRTPMAILLRVRMIVGIDPRSQEENNLPYMSHKSEKT